LLCLESGECAWLVTPAPSAGTYAPTIAACRGIRAGSAPQDKVTLPAMHDTSHTPLLAYSNSLTDLAAADMVTLTLSIHPENRLALAMPATEWQGLVANFARMPVLERTRMGHSIRAAVATSPFPDEGTLTHDQLTPAQQQACDTFVTDCMLLAALAEATTTRVLVETAVTSYHISKGNTVKHRLN
jgi:hypothetical protein